MKYKYLVCRLQVDNSWESNSFTLNKGISAKLALKQSLKFLSSSIDDKTLCSLLFYDKDPYYLPIAYAYPCEAAMIVEGCKSNKFIKLDQTKLFLVLKRELCKEIPKSNFEMNFKVINND